MVSYLADRGSLISVIRDRPSRWLSTSRFYGAFAPMDTLTCSLPTSCVVPIHKSPKDYQAFRISPGDTNRLALVFDPVIADMSLTYCVEIFDVGGKTPPNRHQIAVEMFFVLKGSGLATCDGKTVPIKPGIAFWCRPTASM